MSRRTYEKDGEFIEFSNDYEDLVYDKRRYWRASPSKANRRQRRYQKRLTKMISINNSSFTL